MHCAAGNRLACGDTICVTDANGTIAITVIIRYRCRSESDDVYEYFCTCCVSYVSKVTSPLVHRVHELFCGTVCTDDANGEQSHSCHRHYVVKFDLGT